MRPPSPHPSLAAIALALLAALIAIGLVSEANAGPSRLSALGAPVAPNDFRISDMGPNGVAGAYPALPIVDLAYNPASDQYLVVWSGIDGADGIERVYGQLIDARTGANVGPNDFLIGEGASGADSRTPAAAYNAARNEFLVVWSDYGDTDAIYAQRVGAAGARSGGRLRISGAVSGNPDVAYNSAADEYLVVWESEGAIYAQRLGFSGGSLVETGADDRRISAPAAGGAPATKELDPAVVYNSVNNEYLVLWAGQNQGAPSLSEIYGQRLSAAGEEIGADDFRIDSPPAGGDEAFDAALAYNPSANEYLALWQGEGPDGSFRIYAQRIAGASGAKLGAPALVSDYTSSSTENVFAPQAAYNPALDEYLVVWQGEGASGFGLEADEQEIFGRRYSAALATVEGPFLISDMGPAGDTAYVAQTPAVAYSEAVVNGYLVIWRGDDNVAPLINGEFEIFGQLVAPNANLAVAQSSAAAAYTIGQTVSFTVSYSNLGADPILGATVSDQLPDELSGASCTVVSYTGSAPVPRPAASCAYDIGRLDPGQGGTISIVGTLSDAATNGQVVSSTATIDATTLYADSSSANNSATASIISSEPVLDVSVTLLTSGAAVDAGDSVRYQIQVSHRQSPAADFSQASAYNVALTDALPAILTSPSIASATISDGATTSDVSGAFAIVGGELKNTSPLSLLLNSNGTSDQTLTIIVEGRVADSVAPGATISNSATVTWENETGFRRESYTASGAAPPISVPGALDVTKSAAPANPAPGDTVTFTLTTAVVEGTTANLRFVDTLPAGLSYVPSSAAVADANGMTISGFSTAIAGQTLTIDMASVRNPGATDQPAVLDTDSFTITYQATVGALVANGAPLTNSVAATSDGGLSDPSSQATVTVDAPPRVVSIVRADPSPSNADSVEFLVTFSEPVTGGSAANFGLTSSGALAGASVTGVSGSGATRTVTVSTGSGDGTLRLDATNTAGIADSAGKPLVDLPFTAGAAYTIDKTRPTVTVEQAAGQVDPTNAGPVRFRVVFSEPIDTASFTAADVALGGTASPTNAVITALAPNDGTTFQLAVSGMTNDGTVTAAIPAGAVRDLAGNPNLASTSTDNTVAYDATAPGVTVEQAAGQADPTNAGPVRFRVVFSEPIDTASFTAADITLGGTAGATAATITELAPNDGTTFQLAVSGMTNDGTVTTAIPAGAVRDLAGNPNLASTSTDNTVAYDATAPGGTVEQAADQPDPAPAAPIRFTVVFDEPVTGFDEADIILGGTAGATIVVVTELAPNDGTTFEVAVGGMTSAGTVTASVAAGAASDAAGNTSAASSSADNTVTFAPPAPVVTGIARADADPTRAASVSFIVIFSADVTGVDPGDFALTTGGGISGAAVTGVSGAGATRTVTVSTGAGSGTLRLDLIDDDSIVDGFGGALGGAGAGNGDFSGGQHYTIDREAPQAGQLSVPAAVAGAADLTFTVVFSDNLAVSAASLATGAIEVRGPGGFSQLAALVGVSPADDGTPLTATYRLAAPGGAWDSADNGEYRVSLAAGRVRDGAGNAAAAAELGAFTVSLEEAPATFRLYLPLFHLREEP